ncbi:MAG TPA: response regulator, partial [Chloroflexota bacterium]|nr:response regulator [Chloroflexota bacterium]
DWRMPGQDGLAVCRALRADQDAHLRTIPVVLLTALTSPEDTDAAFEAGATDYLTKPFGVAHVRARVHEWLLRGHSARNVGGSSNGNPIVGIPNNENDSRPALT